MNFEIPTDEPLKEKAEPKHNWTTIILVSIILVIFLVLLWFFWTEKYLTIRFETLEDMAYYGDSFGAINALFSGLAFAGIIITIYLQGRELSFQRRELQQTREVFESQKFDNTFFKLIELYNRISDDETFGKGDGKGHMVLKRGKEAFQQHYNYFNSQFYPSNRGKNIEELSNKFYQNKRKSLTPYFQTIYRIISFVNDSTLRPKEKKFYLQLLKDQLIDEEKFLIFLYFSKFLSGPNNMKYLLAIKQSEILKSFTKDPLSEMEGYRVIYDFFNPKHTC